MPVDPNLKLKASHPFKRGGIFFGMKPPEGWKPPSQNESSPPDSSSSPDQQIDNWLAGGMQAAAKHQMGSQSEKTDGSASSTSADKPDSKS
jgi:hypothetical protein